MLGGRLISVAFVTASLVACSNLAGPFNANIENPDVSLAGLRFAEPGVSEQALAVELRLENPNEFDVSVDGLAFALDINELPFAKGLTDEVFTLPGDGEVVVPVSITIPTTDLIDRVAAIGIGRRLDYRLTGEADIGGWFMPTIPFLREGKLALPSLPGWDDEAQAQ